jgi:hypothetical protein
MRAWLSRIAYPHRNADHHFAESLKRATQIDIRRIAFTDSIRSFQRPDGFVSTSVLRSSKLPLEVRSVSTMRCTSA